MITNVDAAIFGSLYALGGLAAWCLFGFFAYGGVKADRWAPKFARHVCAALGPVGLLIAYKGTDGFEHGFRWRG